MSFFEVIFIEFVMGVFVEKLMGVCGIGNLMFLFRNVDEFKVGWFL